VKTQHARADCWAVETAAWWAVWTAEQSVDETVGLKVDTMDVTKVRVTPLGEQLAAVMVVQTVS
jgi:hypothetical protein